MATIRITNIKEENVLISDKVGSGSLEILHGVGFLKAGESVSFTLNASSILVVTQRNQL